MPFHRLRCIAVTAVGLLASCAETATEGADKVQTQAFSTAPVEPNHEQITLDALGFLRPDVLSLLLVGDTSTDLEFALDSASHFDNCNFSGGSALVATRQAEAVSALDPAALDEGRAIVALGRSLHGLQDFYAHTNWVELGGETLVDASSRAFPTLTPYTTVESSGFVVVQGPPPPWTGVSRDEQAPYPENTQVAVVQLWEQRGLISGTVSYEAGDECPEGASLTHEQLNKDQSSQSDRGAQHALAMRLATQQTRHEWCRLSELVNEAWGEAGRQRLASWVSDPQGAPDCDVE